MSVSLTCHCGYEFSLPEVNKSRRALAFFGRNGTGREIHTNFTPRLLPTCSWPHRLLNFSFRRGYITQDAAIAQSSPSPKNDCKWLMLKHIVQLQFNITLSHMIHNLCFVIFSSSLDKCRKQLGGAFVRWKQHQGHACRIWLIIWIVRKSVGCFCHELIAFW